MCCENTVVDFTGFKAAGAQDTHTVLHSTALDAKCLGRLSTAQLHQVADARGYPRMYTFNAYKIAIPPAILTACGQKNNEGKACLIARLVFATNDTLPCKKEIVFFSLPEVRLDAGPTPSWVVQGRKTRVNWEDECFKVRHRTTYLSLCTVVM